MWRFLVILATSNLMCQYYGTTMQWKGGAQNIFTYSKIGRKHFPCVWGGHLGVCENIYHHRTFQHTTPPHTLPVYWVDYAPTPCSNCQQLPKQMFSMIIATTDHVLCELGFSLVPALPWKMGTPSSVWELKKVPFPRIFSAILPPFAWKQGETRA